MQIIKHQSKDIVKEKAHGGSGARKVLVSAEYGAVANLEAVTRGWLPSGNKFDWHSHDGVQEVMIVVDGNV